MTATAPAYRIDGQPATREAFYAAACDPQRSVVVEACAGAGKTWMLVSRILRALLDGAQPHEILAITFTRKAAGEMRARLDEWLSEFAAPECDNDKRAAELRARGLAEHEAHALAPALAALHERVLRAGRTVEIRTFHAWFSQLLRAAPLELLAELGLQPEMELIEDRRDHEGEVLRRFHAAVLADSGLRADYERLVWRRGRSQLRKWLDCAWDKRIEIELADAAGTLETSVPPVAADGLGHPAQALQSAPWRTALHELALLLQRGGIKAQDAAAGLSDALGLADDAEAMFDAAWKALFTDKGTPRKQLGRIDALPQVQAALEQLAQRVHGHEAHLEHASMVRLSRALLAEFGAYKRSRGLADMADLERCALALLRDATLSGWVQERLDARVRHVLIDEFQDTSPLQWHALHAWLAAYAGAGGGASGQKPPGVFIVGDPKQSIYRFRRAEPRVFDAARAFVEQGLGGSVLACDHTRRNAPEVLAAINGVFGEAQQGGEFSGYRAHTTEIGQVAGAGVFVLPRVARAGKAAEDTESAGDEWRDSLTTPRHDPDEVLRRQEAVRVARAVHELVAGQQVPPGDIHVLCRKRESLRLVAAELSALHLPFAAAEDVALLDAPEARDLVALLDVLASPQHALSLAHALRSPVFGAADDDLIALAQAAAPDGDWWRALLEIDAGSPELQRARELLPRWHAAARQLPPHDLLDLVVAEGEVRERVAAAVPAPARAAALAAIDALLGQALALDGARYATPYNFVRALRRRSITVPAAVQPEAVQLLTIHGAKGLEARVVFLMDADPQPKASETATLLVDWPVESEHPLHCAFVYSEARCPSALEDALLRENAARQREELNGLYVAMSRARERLVLSATEPSRADDGPSWWQRVSPLAGQWVEAGGGAVHGASGATPPVSLPCLPAWTAPIAASSPPRAQNDESSRLGQAVHRVLEWAAAPGSPAEMDLAVLAASAAREFAVGAADVARLAARIRHSAACARFFDANALGWAGNEVSVSDAGEPLRIDRLVALDEAGQRTWWVLDYKLHHAPQALAEYRDQLRRYQAAVQRLQPGETVRCAFVTGAGEVVEVG